jgi:hypothetical protein
MAVNVSTVETAIEGVQESGQTFTVDGVTYSRANLSALIELRDRLKAEASRSGGSRPLFRGINMSGMGY